MSGGYFDYAYSRIQTFADDLSWQVNHAGESGNRELAPDVAKALSDIAALADRTAKLARAAECLYSDDTGDDSFMRAVAEINGGAK